MSEKRQLRATQMNQMLELVDKDFKAVIIKMLQQSIKHSSETSGKNGKSHPRNKRSKRKSRN